MSRLGGLFAAAGPVPIVNRIASCRDPTDDKFPELAVNGRADLIVSGDADLLNPFGGIEILAPAGFLRRPAR